MQRENIRKEGMKENTKKKSFKIFTSGREKARICKKELEIHWELYRNAYEWKLRRKNNPDF